MVILENGLNIYTIRGMDQPKVDSNSDNVDLPPIYKVFVNTYNVGRGRHRNSFIYLNDRFNEKIGVARTVYLPDKDNVMFGEMFSIEESKEVHVLVSGPDSSIPEGYFIIGSDGAGYNLFLVGTSKANLDQIFVEAPDMTFPGGQRITKLADNIFDFMRSFARIENENGVGFGIQYSQLYQNWGEDFWRVDNNRKT